jgi:sterol desaturase/sphingolipid hydroxylase (fatty acid hydroxylase superfamily)
MFENLLANQNAIRLGVFIGVFAAMALWEIAAPRRARTHPRLRRWPSNLGIVVLNTLLLRLVFPAGAVIWAETVTMHGWGILPMLGLASGGLILVSTILLDAAIWLQHVVFHHVPVLWRIHRMHHADLDLDVTSGARFHPVEILLSMVIKFAVIALIGAPASAVLIFEIVLNASAMFNHSNVALPARLDSLLRFVFVTPDMHRIHHSIVRRETDSNFGFCLSWWDRLFRVYREEPAAGQRDLVLGLPQFREAGELRLDRMLTQPVR